jgi:hypothetical protein
VQIAEAGTGIFAGTCFVNAIAENSGLTDLSFILGISVAVINLKSEDSHT